MRATVIAAILMVCASALGASPEPGLLFYLSGDHEFAADYAAGGNPQPTYLRGVQVIPDGAKGVGLRCADTQIMAYWAPGNIYAQRGTLALSWRSRDPVGPTAFPVFRVAFSDHSSWDMCWLRIDYNGHGFDAFVTDASLARVRVSVPLDPFPKPDQWTHLAIAWDETRGIRFYINGKLAAEDKTVAVLNVGLDQFGPHSRIISPHQVQSDYNFVRGGDIDEIRIYDRMLSDENIAGLSKGEATGAIPELPARSLSDQRWRDEWWMRYGFNRPADPPPYIEGNAVSVRKVEIHDAYDLKRWWWKANDGIRETTWPGVFNRSRLPGRDDYFELPDWDCYSLSGKSITFTLPDEPWNQLEISGAAWGKMYLEGTAEKVLFERPKGQEKTVHRFTQGFRGQKIRFENVQQEEPIGELVAYNVTSGKEPAGTVKQAYRLTSSPATNPAIAQLATFITGRNPADERSMLVAEIATEAELPPAAAPAPALPIVHILIPDNWDKVDGGLDGIAIDLPALNVKPAHGDLFPLNIQVKDPLWMPRDMMDFTFSVKPGEAKTLWLDLRDRILPEGRPFYITIAGAGGDFNASMLNGAQVRLIFKSKESAKPEHEIDRFTQARDSYAMLVEEHPRSPNLNLWNRFEADLTDLIKVNPNHNPGKYYAAVNNIGERPVYTQPTPPDGVPLWAFRQVELLKRVKHFVNWYIDNRQIENGEFGGGLSDDTDLTNTWPGVAFMGADPDKLKESLRRELEATFNIGMWTNGLSTIQADELHSYEEGINCLAENLILDYGNPRQIERAMDTARGIERITGINSAGHRHFKSSYYSGTKIAEDGPWGWSKPYSNLVLQVPELLVDFNGNPQAKKVLQELADGYLAHRKGDGSMSLTIHYIDDREGGAGRNYFPWDVFWTQYKWTGDAKYLDPIRDGGSLLSINPNALDILDLRKTMTPGAAPAAGRGRGGRGGGGNTAWQLTGNKQNLETLYASQIEQCDLMDYINTEGSLWIDRVSVPYTDLQKARLGGVALIRNSLFPGHTVSWKFQAPATDQSVAILIPDATQTSFKVIAYNLESTPVRATMTGWMIDPGQWDITQGIDTNNDDVADQSQEARSEKFEKSSSIELTFAPRATTILIFKLKTPGKPYWQRPDLGISRDDLVIQGNIIHVKVHGLSSVDSPPSTLALIDRGGKTIATTQIPAIKAPTDLMPKTADVTLAIPAGAEASGGSIIINPDNTIEEITRCNNQIAL